MLVMYQVWRNGRQEIPLHLYIKYVWTILCKHEDVTLLLVLRTCWLTMGIQPLYNKKYSLGISSHHNIIKYDTKLVQLEIISFQNITQNHDICIYKHKILHIFVNYRNLLTRPRVHPIKKLTIILNIKILHMFVSHFRDTFSLHKDKNVRKQNLRTTREHIQLKMLPTPTHNTKFLKSENV